MFQYGLLFKSLAIERNYFQKDIAVPVDNEVPMDERALRTLDQILAIVKTLKDDMALLDQRISSIEARSQTDQPQQGVYRGVDMLKASSGQTPQNPSRIITNFEDIEEHLKGTYRDLDEHLKETYTALSHSNQALTANQLANLRGRKRSTISDHLNQLFKRDLVEKSRQAKEVLYTAKSKHGQYKKA